LTMELPSLLCEPIGFIRTGMRVKFDAPRQAEPGAPERNVIELIPGHRFEEALRDLEGFERIWLVWWFDRNPNWRPMVRAPRGDTRRRGVFATRAPHRPNPIGITSVRLYEVRGRELIVGGVDLLDRTPILDIKPYISEVDAFPGMRNGWLGSVEGTESSSEKYMVALTPLAAEQMEWLRKTWQVDFEDKVKAILEREPRPSRRHRITGKKDGLFRLSSGSWRVFFSCGEGGVLIERVAPGFPLSLLTKDGFEVIPDYQAQLAFEELWPS